MTRRPPSRIPGAATAPPAPDPARDEYLDAWLACYAAHRRAVRAEARRYAAQCTALLARYQAASARARPPGRRNQVAWTQGTLDETGVIRFSTGEQET